MKLIPVNWKQRDKWAHGLVGIVLYATTALLIGETAGIFVVVLAAFLKEVYDYFGEGNPSFMDVVATVGLPFLVYAVGMF